MGRNTSTAKVQVEKHNIPFIVITTNDTHNSIYMMTQYQLKKMSGRKGQKPAAHNNIYVWKGRKGRKGREESTNIDRGKAKNDEATILKPRIPNICCINKGMRALGVS